jgi:hypothetical protein
VWPVGTPDSLAVVSLVINLTLTWLKWPRIAVEVAQKVGAGFTLRVNPSFGEQPQTERQPSPQTEQPSPPQTDTFILTVINNRSEAITIRSIGFITGTKSGTVRLDALDAQRSPAGEVLPKTLDGKAVVFPARIEGHDCQIYEWDENALATLTRGRRYQGYAERYKSFRWPKCGRSPVCSKERVRRSGPFPP